MDSDNTIGVKTSESRKKITINIAVNPVLPPRSISVALSTFFPIKFVGNTKNGMIIINLN